jgi:hypothetical protein
MRINRLIRALGFISSRKTGARSVRSAARICALLKSKVAHQQIDRLLYSLAIIVCPGHRRCEF